MPELLNVTAMVTQKDGLCSEIYQEVFATPSPRAACVLTRAPGSLAVGPCGGLLQPTVVS